MSRDKQARDAAEESIAFLHTCLDALGLAAQGIEVLADVSAVDLMAEVRDVSARLLAVRWRLELLAKEYAERAVARGLECIGPPKTEGSK